MVKYLLMHTKSKILHQNAHTATNMQKVKQTSKLMNDHYSLFLGRLLNTAHLHLIGRELCFSGTASDTPDEEYD